MRLILIRHGRQSSRGVDVEHTAGNKPVNQHDDSIVDEVRSDVDHDGAAIDIECTEEYAHHKASQEKLSILGIISISLILPFLPFF